LCLSLNSCVQNVDHTKHELGNIIEFFPHLDITNVSKFETDLNPSVTYKINSNEVAEISWESINIYDSIDCQIPKYYELNKSDSNFVAFKHDDNTFKFKVSKFNASTSIDVLEGAYKYTVENNYGFNLISAKHFYDLDIGLDMLIATIDARIEDNVKHTVTLLNKIRNDTYFEIIYESQDKLKLFDYIVISEILTSIKINNNKMIPKMSNISNKVRINL
jgi:hypothetical protein